jgi:hypothetical protein
MGQAHGAEANPPAVARKPAEFIRGFSNISAANYIFKTADLKDDSVGICKSVPMRSLHCDALGLSGDRLMTLAAKYKSLLFGRLIGSILLSDGRFAIFARLFGRYTEKMNTTACCRIHLLNLNSVRFAYPACRGKVREQWSMEIPGCGG